ncbi:MAG: D-arabinono-1,4-lactone oxidase [Verrucomicrobiota bacterium]
MMWGRYVWGGLVTTLNILLYAITFDRFLWLEGRVTRGVFTNWAFHFKYRARAVHYPTSEDEIIERIKSSGKVRVFGSGHSFNPGIVSDEALLSLDRYNAILDFDGPAKRLTVQAGMRVRDVTRNLLQRNLAFVALPSHDAQSIGGILSTDVHGTGRDWGFVHESVVSMKIIDGRGDVHVCTPEDDLFRAAVGGVGAVGIITEVTIQAVERFNIEQHFKISTLDHVEEHFDRLHDENEHFGLFILPFTEKCQLNRWNSTSKSKSICGRLREFVVISFDALMASWVANFISYARLLPRVSDLAHSIKQGTNLVLESHNAHNRSIYHIHQEIEVAVDYSKVFEVCRELKAMSEELYSQGLPYFVLEIRFTPAGRKGSLIGAGRDRRSAWIDIIACDSPGYELLYQKAEDVFKKAGGRPHLGKYCRGYGYEELLAMHGKHFERFLELRAEHDPEEKFSNPFTQRMFTPPRKFHPGG